VSGANVLLHSDKREFDPDSWIKSDFYEAEYNEEIRYSERNLAISCPPHFKHVGNWENLMMYRIPNEQDILLQN
jgi:hypothetical protein